MKGAGRAAAQGQDSTEADSSTQCHSDAHQWRRNNVAAEAEPQGSEEIVLVGRQVAEDSSVMERGHYRGEQVLYGAQDGSCRVGTAGGADGAASRPG